MKISELSSTQNVRSMKGSARPIRLVTPANSNIPSPAAAHAADQSRGPASSVMASVAVIVLSVVFIVFAMAVIFGPDRFGELSDMISSLQFRLTR